MDRWIRGKSEEEKTIDKLYAALEEALTDWENVWDGEDDSIPGWVIHARQTMKEAVGRA